VRNISQILSFYYSIILNILKFGLKVCERRANDSLVPFPRSGKPVGKAGIQNASVGAPFHVLGGDTHFIKNYNPSLEAYLDTNDLFVRPMELGGKRNARPLAERRRSFVVVKRLI
jgi:hypothetical protein